MQKITNKNVYSAIKKHTNLTPKIVKEEFSTNRLDIAKVKSICDDLVNQSKVVKTGTWKYSSLDKNKTLATRRTIAAAIKAGTRLKIKGYKLGDKAYYDEIIHPEQLLGDNVLVKNTQKDGLRQYRINTITSISNVK